MQLLSFSVYILVAAVTNRVCVLCLECQHTHCSFVWHRWSTYLCKMFSGSTFLSFHWDFFSLLVCRVLKSHHHHSPHELTKCPINNQRWPEETCNFGPRNHFHQMLCCPSQWVGHLNDKEYSALRYLQTAIKDSTDTMHWTKSETQTDLFFSVQINNHLQSDNLKLLRNTTTLYQAGR